MTEQQKRLFNLLRKADVWSMRGGSVEIHFDKEGNPATISVHRHFRWQLSTDVTSLDNHFTAE